MWEVKATQSDLISSMIFTHGLTLQQIDCQIQICIFFHDTTHILPNFVPVSKSKVLIIRHAKHCPTN